MRPGEDDRGDEPTGRTLMAQEALIESQRVHMAQVSLRRRVKRMDWLWGMLTLLMAIAGAGYVLRDRIEHFATKEKVDELEQRVSSGDTERKLVSQSLESQREMLRRVSEKLDDLTAILLRERGRGDRR